MKLEISSLVLTNFRSYRQAEFTFASQTAIVGPNAAGKTNLLEALYLLSSTKSFRAERELEMLNWGTTEARVSAWVKTDRSRNAVVQLRAGARTVQKAWSVDGTKRKARDFVRSFPTVLFAADDVRLIDGAPGRRRRALDLAISQSSADYHEAVNRYGRVLASRNRLLEQVMLGEATHGELDFWDAQLADSGQVLIDGRYAFADFLNGRLTEQYRAISERTGGTAATGQLKLAYEPLAADFAAEVQRRRSQDIAVGTTTAGPHRDDWKLVLAGRALSSFGSGGEYRTAMLAFRMAEVAWLEDHLSIMPALLLDDVFSELDDYRRDALLAHLPETQTILTTPEVASLPNAFRRQAAVITLGAEEHV